VYQTDNAPGLYVYNGTQWLPLQTQGDNLGNHTATQALNLQGQALTGTGASLPTGVVGVGVRADGGLNLGQNNNGNIYLGYQAGRVNTGTGNVFSGCQSGYSNTTGNFNQFSGCKSGYYNTTGTNNQFSGFESGFSNTTGNYNTFNGCQSGYYNTTGTNNQFSGYQSGISNYTGSNNLFSGYQSGLYNITGSNNTALGYNSGPANGNGALTNATALGANVDLTQSNTVVLGSGADVGIGTSTPAQKLDVAGTTRTTNAIVTTALTGTGADLGTTVGVGIRADGGLNLGQNTAGNIYLGYQAGRVNRGNFNQFSGYQSGYSNTTSNFNQFSGYQSGYSNTTGNFNQFSGYQSGYSNTTGSINTFNGYQSGYRNTTGFNNQFSGFQSGVFNTTGSNNLFSGYNSGFYNTTGSSNTALGYNSGPATGYSNLTNATALGANVDLTQSNTVVLGNGADVGIGTSAPTARLDVNGDQNLSGTLQLNTTDQDKILLTTAGAVGSKIGHANGWGVLTYAGPGTGSQGYHSWLTSGASAYAERMRLDANGNLGIGTSTPGQMLELAGQAAPALLLHSNTNGVMAGATLQFRESSTVYGWNLRHNSGGREGGSFNDRLVFESINGGTRIPVLTLDQVTNSVGIGTVAPWARLHVSGGVTNTFANTGNISYFSATSGFQSNQGSGVQSRTVCAYFQGGNVFVDDAIHAGRLQVSSDARIKCVVGRSSPAADLALLNQLRITDYTYLDAVAHGPGITKKVIAQEVEAVLPAAVSRSTQALPNVYARATAVAFAGGLLTLTCPTPHGLPAAGGRLRLYTATNEAFDPEVTVVDAHTVRFAAAQAYPDGLFVYGKFVDDFRSVDYDALTTLNVSATQELARQVAALQAHNAALQTRAAALEARADQAAADHADLQTLKQQLAGLQAAGTQARQPDAQPTSRR
jgi:Chaperone of endosialidase